MNPHYPKDKVQIPYLGIRAPSQSAPYFSFSSFSYSHCTASALNSSHIPSFPSYLGLCMWSSLCPEYLLPVNSYPRFKCVPPSKYPPRIYWAELDASSTCSRSILCLNILYSNCLPHVLVCPYRNCVLLSTVS